MATAQSQEGLPKATKQSDHDYWGPGNAFRFLRRWYHCRRNMNDEHQTVAVPLKNSETLPDSRFSRLSCRTQRCGLRQIVAGAAGLFLIAAVASCCDSRHAIRLRDASSDITLDGGGGNGAVVDGSEQSEEAGRTMAGIYTCCAPNEGMECCTSILQGLCYRYGGSAGRCLIEGESSDGKDICAVCCSGLSKTHPDVVSDVGAECQSTATPSMFICVRCGDGVCDEFENRCRCPADCP